MGLFSSIAGRSSTDASEEPWLANLMDDETVPLAELEAATNPFVAPPNNQPGNAWNMPDLGAPNDSAQPNQNSVVPPALAGVLNEAAAPEFHSFDSGHAGTFDAAPFADAAPASFDSQMLSLDPIPHDTAPVQNLMPSTDLGLSLAPSIEPDISLPYSQAVEPESEPTDPAPTSSWGQGFGNHLASLPDTFDRRLADDEQVIDAAVDPGADRHHGPTGPHAPAQLEAFGLEPGASWSELRDRYLAMLSTTDCGAMTAPAEAAELDSFRRQINTGYAALRLLAAH